MAINLNNISVGADGRITFGGLRSGIDFQSAIEGIIKARRIPVDTLENRAQPCRQFLDLRNQFLSPGSRQRILANYFPDREPRIDDGHQLLSRSVLVSWPDIANGLPTDV